MKWPFTVHRDTRFENLIKQLIKLEIVELKKYQEAYLLVIQDQETLLEIFSTLFLFYAIPTEKPMTFYQDGDSQLVVEAVWKNLHINCCQRPCMQL